MGWPYDARRVNYGPLQPIDDADLNAIQDRIVDLYRVKTRVFFNGAPEFLGSSPTAIPGWFQIGGGHGAGVVQPKWRAQATGSNLVIPIELPLGAQVLKAEVKFELNTATGIVFDLVSNTTKFDAHGDDPVGTLLGTVTPGAVGPDVDTIDITGTPHTIAADDLVYLLVHSHDVGDDVFGVRVTYMPLIP